MVQRDVEEVKDATFRSGLEELQESSASVIQEIAVECYSGYLQAFPFRDDWAVDSFLKDEENCMQTSGIIITSFFNYFKAPLIPCDKEQDNIKDSEATPNKEKQKDEHSQRKNGVST